MPPSWDWCSGIDAARGGGPGDRRGGRRRADRNLENALVEVTPTDTATFLGSAAVLLGVALLAGLLPARRATAVDPLVVLKDL